MSDSTVYKGESFNGTRKLSRQHQVRRHLKHLSHPVMGDATHGKGPLNRAFSGLFAPPRLLLACVELGLAHPADGRPLRLHAPLEPGFGGICAKLGWEPECGEYLVRPRPERDLAGAKL